ncbi:hypothetical protein RND81_12G048600 [Saponaria officinalis]|uniref:CCR4-NOT transcription complex subunit 3 n=1 Tax=Saponaria officinalis TaxID=3572 RepID=A0AAW1H4Z3_SAPOF
MGASRKLQGEIDRVLKKVQEGVDVFDSIWNKVYDTDNANQKEKFEADLKKEIKKLQRYRDQIKTWIQSSEIKDKKALMDSRKLIEREMERFKICEKETKTKAFSKEGLGQQPKTDPKEKAKSETRDWINNVVGELTSQIDSFEAEMEGLSVKKGKTRPPRLTHLEASIARHKAHVMKLELILRLLDNEELSPEQVNDVKDFLEDYVERNQEDFDEFSDVDELYSTLPLDKVEALEDLVSIVQPGIVKGAAAAAANSVLSLKTPLSAPALQSPATVSSSLQTAPVQEQEETASQESASDTAPRTPPSKVSSLTSSAPSNSPGNHTVVASSLGHVSALPSSSAAVSGLVYSRGFVGGNVTVPSSPPHLSNVNKEEEPMNFPGRKSSPALSDTTTPTKGAVRGNASVQQAANISPNSVGTFPSTGMTLGAVPLASEMAKRNISGSDERLGVSVSSGRAFPSVPGIPWRPGSSLQSQSEVGQIRGRTEIAPDQREKFLQKLQQVQQQGHSNVLGMASLTGGNFKTFSAQQQNPLLQQLGSQNSPNSSQGGLGLGLQSTGLSTGMSASVQQQPISILQQGSSHVGQKDTVIEDQQHQSLADESATEMPPGSGLSKQLINDDDLEASYVKDISTPDVSGPLAESSQVTRDIDLTPGQPLQSGQQSSTLGVIGRRSVSDLGAIGDSISGTPSSGSGHDYQHNLQMLEAAYFKLPQPRDSERAKSYTPRHPTATPSSYPQVQAPVVNNPAFWERLGHDTLGTDTLFFAFYYQPFWICCVQNTYQQYLAAKELKKQSWRYHRKFNTWFQRHEEPKVTTDDYEKGTYVYFDFHVANEDPNQGWCQRIKTDFIFEYNYLEDELLV